MAKHGKKYRELADKKPTEAVTLEEAVKLIPELTAVKFTPACEMHFNLGIDPKHADQTVRTTVVLPHGTGKSVKVVAFCSDDKVEAAKKAGAEEAGIDNLVSKIESGWTDFDVAVAEPAAMKSIGKIAKILGQKGLMPNPKAGTVGDDVVKMVEDVKKGKVELRNDKTGNLHVIFGKADFDTDKLTENAKSIVSAVKDAKPTGIKGTYVKGVYICTSMGPSVKIDPSTI